MNTKRTQPATQKTFFKASRNMMSKNNVKLDTLTHQSHPSSDGGKTNQPKLKNIKALQKLEKVQSTILKNLKPSNHQFNNEPVCNMKNQRVNRFELTNRLSNIVDFKQQQKSVENKTGTSKSFTFRVKNLSCYKKMEECSKFVQVIQDIHQQVMEEIAFGNTLEFKGKVSMEKKSNSDYSIEGENQNKIEKQSRGPLRTSQNHHPNSMKVKPVLCKDLKKTSKLFTEGQNQVIPKVCQEIQNRLHETSKKNIECILKKFKKISKHEQESITNFKIHLVKNEQPEDHFHPIDTKALEGQYGLNLQKSKGFNGCKTIRIPWNQNQGLSDNEIVNKRIKRLQTSQKRQSQQQMQFDRDDIFGGISIISKKPSLTSNIEGISFPIQSLKELFKQLKQSCSKDEEEAISKELILD